MKMEPVDRKPNAHRLLISHEDIPLYLKGKSLTLRPVNVRPPEDDISDQVRLWDEVMGVYQEKGSPWGTVYSSPPFDEVYSSEKLQEYNGQALYLDGEPAGIDWTWPKRKKLPAIYQPRAASRFVAPVVRIKLLWLHNVPHNYYSKMRRIPVRYRYHWDQTYPKYPYDSNPLVWAVFLGELKWKVLTISLQQS